MIVLIIIIYVMLAVYEFLPLYKENKSKELLVNGGLYMFSFIIAVLICIGVSIPSPAGPIKNIISSLFGR